MLTLVRSQSIRGGEYPHWCLNSWIASHNSWKWFILKLLILGMKLHEAGVGFQFSHRSRAIKLIRALQPRDLQMAKLEMKEHRGFPFEHFVAYASHILASLHLATRLPRCHGSAAKRLTLLNLPQSFLQTVNHACSVHRLDASNQLYGDPVAFKSLVPTRTTHDCRTYLPWAAHLAADLRLETSDTNCQLSCQL